MKFCSTSWAFGVSNGQAMLDANQHLHQGLSDCTSSQELRTKISKETSQFTSRNPSGLASFGMVGAGKSSYINTVATFLDADVKVVQAALVAEGGFSITLTNTRVKVPGATDQGAWTWLDTPGHIVGVRNLDKPPCMDTTLNFLSYTCSNYSLLYCIYDSLVCVRTC